MRLLHAPFIAIREAEIGKRIEPDAGGRAEGLHAGNGREFIERRTPYIRNAAKAADTTMMLRACIARPHIKTLAAAAGFPILENERGNVRKRSDEFRIGIFPEKRRGEAV